MSFNSIGQIKVNPENKGKIFFIWGYNWGYYSKSDIHFSGNNFDFDLANVKASDRQTQFAWEDYFAIESLTTPQTNLRLGYYINDNLNIAVGVDHMKYFMSNDQVVNINGYISQSGTIYDNTYNNDLIRLSRNFLSFEHSDGLNYMNLEINYAKDILSWTDHANEKLQIYLTGGAGLGILVPETNATIIGMLKHDAFNIAGYGMALKTGINITFFKHIFLQSELKGGFINMPNIRTTNEVGDSASQHFFSLMPDILIGAIFKIAHRK